jgi:hypothetical protein
MKDGYEMTKRNATKILLGLGFVLLVASISASTARGRAARRQRPEAADEAGVPPAHNLTEPDPSSSPSRSQHIWRTLKDLEVRDTVNKRLIVGLVSALVVFGGVFAFAASMTLSADQLGANDAQITPCDANGVSTSYTYAFSTTEYKVTEVKVNGIADLCDTKTVKVQLMDNSNAEISGASGTGTVSTASGSANARSVTITLGTPASAEAASWVHVVIG